MTTFDGENLGKTTLADIVVLTIGWTIIAFVLFYPLGIWIWELFQ